MYTDKDGNEYVRRYGTRCEVYDGVVYETAGHLKKDDLVKRGSKYISKKRMLLGKKRYAAKNPFKNEKADPEPPLPEEKRDLASGPPRRLRKKRRRV